MQDITEAQERGTVEGLVEVGKMPGPSIDDLLRIRDMRGMQGKFGDLEELTLGLRADHLDSAAASCRPRSKTRPSPGVMLDLLTIAFAEVSNIPFPKPWHCQDPGDHIPDICHAIGSERQDDTPNISYGSYRR